MNLTLDDIRHRARETQKRDGYSYCHSLEIEAKKAGFNTFAAAKVALPDMRKVRRAIQRGGAA